MTEENKVEENKINLTGIIVFLALVILFIFFVNFNLNEHEKYKKTFKGEAIGLTTKIKHSNKTSFLKYYFYSDKKILSEVSSRDYELGNKFYKVKYDLNNPLQNYIVLEKELKPDSISLVKSGFTKIKYYIYDGGVTCKYIEKSKWK